MFAPNTRILVVDDMKSIRRLICKNFNDLGYTNIIEAGDGVQAWQTIFTADPPINFVSSDWNMPNATGLDLLKKIRGDNKFGNLPFLLITAERDQVKPALDAGADACITKPFTTEILRENLQNIYKKRNPGG